MEKTALLEHLEAAKKEVRLDRLLVDQQKQLIAALAEVGADTSEAERLLQTFEETQSWHLSDMQQILNALETMPPDDDA